MFRGALALVIRYLLLIGGTALATTGVITATSATHFCFDAKIVADAVAAAVAMMLGGGASVLGGIVWRTWAKRRGGVT